ncbi:MAG: hypothetical protein NW207_06275 [Cytophagales bacterium]|nr:hypothetical protein [Cytophagales bacterium]
MKNIKPFVIMLATLGIAIAMIAWVPAGEGLVVIVNEGNPIEKMTASQVKLNYLRKINKRWKEINKNIVPVDTKNNSDLRKSFLKDVLDMSSDEFTRHFTEREYQNAEAPPVKMSSDSEVVEYVENNIGAIGFVDKSSTVGKKVKIVFAL